MLLDLATTRKAVNWDATRDDELLSLISAVETEFDRLTGRTFAQVTNAIEVIELGNVYHYTRLKSFPLTALKLSVWDYGLTQPVFDIDTTLLTEGTDYRPNLRNGTIEFVNDYDRLVAQISGGYSPTTLPKDVAIALMTQAQFLIAKRTPEAVAVTFKNTVGVGGQSFEQSPQHPLFLSCVQRYRSSVV